MKNALHYTLAILFYGLSFSLCFSQDVTFNSQADVDAFDNSITAITGDLTIESFITDPIVDLSNLLNLTSVGGTLVITSTEDLTNLNGLNNLNSIDGNITMYFNDALTDISGLNGLTHIGGDLQVNENEALINFNGFTNLNSISGGILIQSNDALTDISSFDNLTQLGEYIKIENHNALLNISGFNNLTLVGGYLSIYSNDVLMVIDGFNNLTTVNNNLQIQYNDALISLDGFLNLITVGGALKIENQDALLTIDGFVNLNSIGFSLSIDDNLFLINIQGFTNLNNTGTFSLSNNEQLLAINGFANLISTGSIFISGNDALTNLYGLEGINQVGGGLSIYLNNSLTNCCAVQELLITPGAISGSASIYANPSECSSVEELEFLACRNFNLSTNPPCINAENRSIYVQLLDGNGPFTYNWERIEDNQLGDGISDESNFVIENLGTGTYNLTITDSNGLDFLEDGLSLTPVLGSVFEIIELTSTNSSNGTSNGAIHLTVAGGTSPYELSWSGAESGFQTDIISPELNIPLLQQGEYEITVSDDIGNQQIVVITLLDETTPVFPCTQPLDIVILNDVSSSVDAVEYEESKQFFVDFLNAVNIGPNAEESRAAILEWSSSSDQSIQIPMTGNSFTLQDYINNDRSFSGGTSPHQALIFGENYLAGIARPDVARVLILSTDASSGQVGPSSRRFSRSI